ncbi:MAG: bifunctional folylpolyglutamate synthase/dihydrofolate synthase [Wenzhouxiangella sp.]
MSRGALDQWLARLEARTPETRIELGLERVRQVFDRLALDLRGCRVVTVAGTNGKGSVVAFLESLARQAGRRVLAYTSPHLVDFAERMRLDGQPAPEAAIVAELDRVEQARGQDYLSYFEQITLAALCLAERSAVELVLLEVGLGGRLDAVNVVDADVAVLTSIGLDHTEWLGPTRLAIGREKIAVARAGRPLVIGEKRLPAGLNDDIAAIGCQVWRAGRHFRWRRQGDGFLLTLPGQRQQLPMPAMAGPWQLGNAACALAAWHCLGPDWALTDAQCAAALGQAFVPGRLQTVHHDPDILLDVAHNPAAARLLAKALGPVAAGQRSLAVFSALRDKAVEPIARALNGCFSDWLLAPLPGPRGRSVGEIQSALQHAAVGGRVEALESVADALKRARELAGNGDRIVVFGSFHTVAEAWPVIKKLG